MKAEAGVVVVRILPHGSAGEYQDDERASVGAQLASIRQMSRQLSLLSAGEYQADEQAGVARLLNISFAMEDTEFHLLCCLHHSLFSLYQ